MLIDSHCHLDFADFEAEGVAAVVARARDAGVTRMMTISCKLAEFDRIRAIAESDARIDCSLGTHPHSAGEATEQAFTAADIVNMAAHPKVVALGETGLDYYYDFSPKDAQHAVFTRHIEAAIETGLPLIIHTRDAEEDTMRLLREAGKGRVRGVMHCFTGSQWLADQALDIGFYVSFSGILTFKKSEELRRVAAGVPMDRLLVETDSPYLAPMPYRGKRNEPAYVAETAKVLAAVKGVSPEDMARQTTDNYYTLFTKAAR
jgi:TatD DNase family protein